MARRNVSNELRLDSDAFDHAASTFEAQADALLGLADSIDATFDNLRQKWDSQAGDVFFERLECNLIDCIKKYADAISTRGGKLRSAATKYDAVFAAANELAAERYG